MESSRLFAEDEATREWQRGASDDDAPEHRLVQAGRALSAARTRKPPPPPPRRVAPPSAAPRHAAPASPARPPQESAIFVVPMLPGAGRRALPPPPNHASRRPLPSPPPKAARPLPAPPASRASALPGPAPAVQPLPAFALPRTGEFAALAITGASGLPSFALPTSAFANGAGRPTALPAFSSSSSPDVRGPLPAFQVAPARSSLPAFSLRDEQPANDASERLFGPDENTRQKPLAAPMPAASSAGSFRAPLSSAPLSRPSAMSFPGTDLAEPGTPRIIPHPAFAARARAHLEPTPAAMRLSVPPTPPAPRLPSPSTLVSTDVSVARAGAAAMEPRAAGTDAEVAVNPPPAAAAPSNDPVVKLVASIKLALARRVHPRGPTLLAVLAAAAPVLVILAVFFSGPSTGQLRVNTSAKTDGRVDVFVDGRKVCEAVPCVVGELEPGERTVRVMADGFDAAPAVTVEVEPGTEVVATVPLGEPERSATTTVQPTAIPTATLGVILPATQRVR